jgi:protein SCO1/2
MATTTSPGLARFRMILWGLVVVAAIAATALFVFSPPRNPVGVGLGGGTYSLVDGQGQPVDQAMLTGHPSLLFFGYTHCPDVCPTTMAEMATWLEMLGPAADGLKAYFVTVDPERDTPEVLGDYVGWMDGKVTAVTGSRPEIDKMMAAWKVLGEKVGTGDDYTMNHTASVFLVNPQGGFEGTIAYGENADTAVAKIRKLVGA